MFVNEALHEAIFGGDHGKTDAVRNHQIRIPPKIKHSHSRI